MDQIAPILLFALAGLGAVSAYIFGIYWGISDAKERGGTTTIAAMFMLLGFPLGWLLWLIVRPKLPSMLEQRVKRRVKRQLQQLR